MDLEIFYNTFLITYSLGLSPFSSL